MRGTHGHYRRTSLLNESEACLHRFNDFLAGLQKDFKQKQKELQRRRSKADQGAFISMGKKCLQAVSIQ